MNKPYIVLTRYDLIDSKKNLPISDILICDFKTTTINIEELNAAKLVVFKDGEHIKEFKNVHRVLQNNNKIIK